MTRIITHEKTAIHPIRNLQSESNPHIEQIDKKLEYIDKELEQAGKKSKQLDEKLEKLLSPRHAFRNAFWNAFWSAACRNLLDPWIHYFWTRGPLLYVNSALGSF